MSEPITVTALRPLVDAVARLETTVDRLGQRVGALDGLPPVVAELRTIVQAHHEDRIAEQATREARRVHLAALEEVPTRVADLERWHGERGERLDRIRSRLAKIEESTVARASVLGDPAVRAWVTQLTKLVGGISLLIALAAAGSLTFGDVRGVALALSGTPAAAAP